MTIPQQTLNIAAYKFASLDNLQSRREALQELTEQARLKGTILLAAEGINLFVAGSREGIDRLLEHLQTDTAIGPLEVKESFTDHVPFNRMLVKIKREIIAFGVDGITPAQQSGRKLPPRQLKEWLDQGRDLTLLDTRNDYEIKLGTFENATVLPIDHFRQFPAAIEQLPAETRSKPLVMFCTGGIRCEKAGPLMEQRGFREVYQLEGGILKYFEEVGQQYYKGDCFVFDQRVAVDAALRETDAAQCYACQAILTAEEQQSPQYRPPESCPYCYQTSQDEMAQTIAERQQRLRALATPLPGSTPYDQRLPLHVPGRCDTLPLLDFLCIAVPSAGREYWQQEIELSRILLLGQPVAGDRIVAAGEKYEHLLPGMVEPAVNAEIEILHEDAALVVVNKPAPLPMHPGGRFNKNSLSELLVPLYHPERLRHAHRLDASTTGLALFTRTRQMARALQGQFSDGLVQKTYLVQVTGHPQEEEFTCHAPIANEPTAGGARLEDPQGQPAETRFRLLARHDDGTSLLQAEPITGRTNQIRLHLWTLGLPIVGDPTYLPDGQMSEQLTLEIDDPPMYLHAWRLQFRHPASGEPMELEAPLPEWAQAAFSAKSSL